MSASVERNKEIVASIKQTLEASSVHAIPNITRARNWTIKGIWIVCLLISVSACAWYLSVSVSTYLEYNVVTKTQINYALTLSFPVVSICNANCQGIYFKTIRKTNFLKQFDTKCIINKQKRNFFYLFSIKTKKYYDT